MAYSSSYGVDLNCFPMALLRDARINGLICRISLRDSSMFNLNNLFAISGNDSQKLYLLNEQSYFFLYFSTGIPISVQRVKDWFFKSNNASIVLSLVIPIGLLPWCLQMIPWPFSLEFSDFYPTIWILHISYCTNNLNNMFLASLITNHTDRSVSTLTILIKLHWGCYKTYIHFMSETI